MRVRSLSWCSQSESIVTGWLQAEKTKTGCFLPSPVRYAKFESIRYFIDIDILQNCLVDIDIDIFQNYHIDIDIDIDIF